MSPQQHESNVSRTAFITVDSPWFFCFVPPPLLQACGDPKAKPSYLVDKNLESAVKFIVRKFPAVETRNNNVSVCVCVSLCVFLCVCVCVCVCVRMLNLKNINLNIIFGFLFTESFKCQC